MTSVRDQLTRVDKAIKVTVVPVDRGPIPTVPLDVIGPIWGMQINDVGQASGDEWFSSDGSTASTDIIEPPDPDAWYIADLGGPLQDPPTLPAGGSDGRFHYLPVISANGDWYVDKFDLDMTELVDRWPIAGWNSMGSVTVASSYIFQQSTLKHLAASKNRVVVIGDRYDPTLPGSGHTEIDIAVFETAAGTQIASHVILTPYRDDFGDTDTIDPNSGSCIDTDETKVFFAFSDFDTQDVWIVSVDLASGELTKHFDVAVLNETILAQDPTWEDHGNGFVGGYGIVEDLGDVFIVGHEGFARVQLDGTPVWWDLSHLPLSAPDSFGNTFFEDGYQAIALSGHRSVFACVETTGSADEFTYDGSYLKSPTFLEPMRHAWLAAVLSPNLLSVIHVEPRIQHLRKVTR